MIYKYKNNIFESVPIRQKYNYLQGSDHDKKMLFISSTDINETNFGGIFVVIEIIKLWRIFNRFNKFSKLDNKNQFKAPKISFYFIE